jgi:2-phosphosulfolactate phosphatase
MEGEEGCIYARENDCVAVVVDALRASATAVMLLHSGAVDLQMVRDVAGAFEAKEAMPGALLFGERGGFPPEGFDFGNSPRDAERAKGRRVIFTTTTGTGRLLEAHGAPAVYMGTTLNAIATARAASAHERDVVLIPAGLAGDPEFDAQEDWVAAVAIALTIGADIGEGARNYREWKHMIELDGVAKLFETAPHADKLKAVGLGEDISYCARMNLTSVVPEVLGENEFGLSVGLAPA